MHPRRGVGAVLKTAWGTHKAISPSLYTISVSSVMGEVIKK